MKTVKLNAFNNPFVYGIDNKEYLVFNIDNETQTLKFQSLIGDLKVKTANILFKSNSLPAKLYEMVVDDDILTFTLPSVLTGYNGSMYVYLLLNYSDDLSTSDLYTFKLVDKGSSTFNFEISSICESNISTIVSEEIKNEGIAKSILDTVSNYEFDKLQHAQQSLSLVEHAFSSTLEKRIDLFNSAYDKANETKSNTTGDINDSDIDIPDSNTDSDLKDYVENVKKQMAERLKDVTAVSEQIQDEMAQEKQSFLGSSLIFQQDLKQERDIISAYGESTRQHMDQEFNEVKDHADKVFADFSKEIPDLDASIKQVNDKIVATDNKVGTLNTKVTNVENDITELEKMHNEVTQTINNGKLISLYSNSLDFGDYDYSGNPNLMSVIKASDFRRDGNSDVLISDVGYNSIRFTTQNVNNIKAYTQSNISSLVSGKTYTISAKVKIEEGTTGNIDQIKVSYRKTAGGTILLSATATGIEVGKEITIKGTGVVNYAINDLSRFYLSIWVGDDINGSVIVSDVKIEEGSTATPYQPNLLDAPYYLSKVALGENIADPKVKFPITTTQYPMYIHGILKKWTLGKTYSVTMKATKPATQKFYVYLASGSIYVGTMTPVEGLVDVWTLTVTVQQDHIDQGADKVISIYQYPTETKGEVKIDWLKVEESDTRTPNISQFKYFGEGLKDSNNPNDYSWDITPEYAEKSLNDTISLTDSKVAELGSVKADKTALSQTNTLLANGLNSKVDKGGNEQISMGMLTTEVKKAMTGGSVAVVGNGSVNTSAMVDNAATSAKRTRLGEMGLVTIFNGARMDFDFVNRKITIPATANIINRKDKYEKKTMTELPFIQGLYSQSLVYDVSIKDFCLIGSSDPSSFNENMLLLAHINTDAGYVSSPSDYTVNGTKAEDRYYNYVAYYGGLISSKKIGSSVKLFFSTPLEKIHIKTRNSSKIIIVENQELEIPHNYSLVADFNENILKIVDSDRINYAFQMPLVSVHNGLIKYSALLISNATTHAYDSVVAYPAGEILSHPVGSGVRLTFTGIDRNSSFYVKTRTGNHIINLKSLSIFDQSSNSITVPHNSSLVFNDILKTFEIINSDLIERDKHIVFISVHNGLIKWNVGLRLVDQNQSVPQIEYRRPINKRDLYVSQGGCVVGNQLWLFEDAGATHAVEKRIWRLNANDLSDIDTIPHTMAHCNGVDFIDGYLLVFNGAATPPEINITKNVTEETASLYFSSSENTQIVFKEGSKQLEGDGSACFGEAFNIVYYAGYAGIYKILLGTGKNDLSDKTVDKSDMSSWGTFISGRSIDEYNGTARILRKYTGPSLGQPQDMIFDGKLYIQRDYSTLNYSALTFNDDTNSYSISERVEIDVRDENYNKMHIEPEAITFYKNKIIMGGRGQKNILASIYRK